MFRKLVWAEFHVAGMSCDHCITRATAALKRLSGVRKVRVDLKTQRVRVGHDGVESAALAAALDAAGYPMVE